MTLILHAKVDCFVSVFPNKITVIYWISQIELLDTIEKAALTIDMKQN